MNGVVASQVPQAELKRALGDGAREIDRLNDEQVPPPPPPPPSPPPRPLSEAA